MYLNICTYMSQQMQLMYTETPCFGENKRNQKKTQNTRKYIFRRATKVTISKICEKQNRGIFLAGVTETNDVYLQLFFVRNAAFFYQLSPVIKSGIGHQSKKERKKRLRRAARDRHDMRL